MDVTFKKRKKDLEGEVKVKSMEIEHIDEKFQPKVESCELTQKFITISPECIRCNLCVEECPVRAIAPATSSRPAKILDECVNCEICAETCPVNAIKVIESTSNVSEENEEIKYHIKDIKVPHRKLRMKDIRLDENNCKSCDTDTCIKFCPTGAITVKEGEVVRIDKDLCVGCGACVNVCGEEAIVLERELGPVIKTKDLLIDQETCVQCQVCEENCPMDAIKIKDDKIVLYPNKCILCDVCSTKCPVGALKLEKVAAEKVAP